MDTLAGRRLLASPGLSTVLKATALYRAKRKDMPGFPPEDFLDPAAKDRDWLFCEKKALQALKPMLRALSSA